MLTNPSEWARHQEQGADDQPAAEARPTPGLPAHDPARGTLAAVRAHMEPTGEAQWGGVSRLWRAQPFVGVFA